MRLGRSRSSRVARQSASTFGCTDSGKFAYGILLSFNVEDGMRGLVFTEQAEDLVDDIVF
jgi:hypothetical protein